MRTHETTPDDTGHVNILSKAEWLRLYSRPKRLSVRGARRDPAPQQRDHAHQQRDSAPQQRSKEQPPCLRERKASSSSSDPRLKRSVRWADDEEESGERARRGDREEARYHPEEEANEEKDHAQLQQQGANQAEGAKLQGANEKEERQRRNAEEEDEEGLDEEQMEALATARASLQAKHLQEAMEEERRLFDLEEAAREANTFGPNEGARRLYSALLLTEVMKEREAQLDMKRRIRERQHAEQRQEEEQRRCFVAAQEERVRLWRDREAEKFRESQAARDRVFHKLAALQLDKESRERRREEEQVTKYLAEQEAKQAQILREEAEAKEQLYRSFAADRADRLAPEMPER